MLRLGRKRNKLTIVSDQIGVPTPAGAIAKACLRIADALTCDVSLSGTYHFSGTPDVSWADFACEKFRQAGGTCQVQNLIPPWPNDRKIYGWTVRTYTVSALSGLIGTLK